MIQINTLEEFKDVKDYYYVERDVIYSKKGKLKVLNQYNGPHGYQLVHLQTKNAKQKSCYVHRIIATAYIPNPHNKPTVNHINHDRTDNRPENLEWATHSEQCNNIWMEKCKEHAKHQRKKVMLKDVENCRVIVFQSLEQCAEYLGVHKSAISKAIKNGRPCQGYILKYIEKTKNTKKFAEI